MTKTHLILGLLLLIFVRRAICQNDTAVKFLFGHVGILSDNKDRLGFQGGLNYCYNKNFFSIRYYQSEEFLVGFPLKDPRVNYITDMKNLSLMYGFTFSNKYFKLIPMAGLSVGLGNWRNNKVDTIKGQGFLSLNNYVYHYENFKYFGIDLGLNVIFTPTKYFGLGLHVFENFHLHPDNGIAISIIVGRIRE